MGDRNVSPESDEPDLDMAEALGRIIKIERTARGWHRKQLAEASGLSYPYVSEIENGSKQASSRALRELARALELSPSELLRAAEDLGSRQDRRSRGDVVNTVMDAVISRYASPSSARSMAAAQSAQARAGNEAIDEIMTLLRRMPAADVERIRDLVRRLTGGG